MAGFLTLLLLCLALSAQPSHSHHGSDEYLNLKKNDTHFSIILNQLAILNLLNETTSSRVQCESNLHRVRELEQDLQQERAREQKREREWNELKEIGTELRTMMQGLYQREQMKMFQEDMRHFREDMTRTLQESRVPLQTYASPVHDRLAISRNSHVEESNRQELITGIQHLRDDLEAVNHHTSREIRGLRNKIEAMLISTNTTKVITQFPGGERNVSNSTECLTSRNSFPAMVANNCIYVERTMMNFTAARTNCKARGGDLFIPGDFSGMLTYITESSLPGWTWVGVQKRAWLDGRNVTTDEWKSGQPNRGPESCAEVNAGSTGLDDEACSTTRISLCQIGMSFN